MKFAEKPDAAAVPLSGTQEPRAECMASADLSKLVYGNATGADARQVEIVSTGGEGIVFWQVDPPVDTGESKDLQVEALREGLRFITCNGEFADIMGLEDPDALSESDGAELIESVGLSDKLQELVDTDYRIEAFQITLQGAGGEELAYSIATHCILQDDQLTGIWSSLSSDSQRVARERELAVNRQLLQDSQGMAGIGCWSSDFHGNFDFQSEQLARLFGLPTNREYTFEETLQRVHPADREMLLGAREQAMSAEGITSVEFRVIHDDGSLHHLRSTARTFFNEDGEPARWLGSMQEVTRDKLQAEARHTQYLHLPDPLFTIDLDTPLDTDMPLAQQAAMLTEQGRIADCNHALAEAIGQPRNDLVGERASFLEDIWTKNASRFCRESYRLEDRQLEIPQAGDAASLTFELSLYGTVEDGKLWRVWGYCRDITEQAQVRDSLEEVVKARTDALYKEVQLRRQNADQLKQQAIVVSNMSEAVIVTDLELEISDWNRGAEAMFGFSSDAVLGKTLDELLSPSGDPRPDGRDGDGDWVQAIDGWRGELTCLRQDGQAVICESSITVLKDEEDVPLSLVHVLRDVGERRRYEDDLAMAKETAERANQAKTRFIRGLSHEMRTPLNAILGFGQLLERLQTQPLNERQQTYLKQIRTGGEHLLELVNEVLDLARIEAGELGLEPAIVDIGELIDECLQLLRPQATERQVSVQGNYHIREKIVADPTRVKQVLFNLLSNGVKYNSSPGELNVTIESVADAHIRITVADTGQGIPEDLVDALYEPFNRLGVADVSVQGTGLGLTITRELVAAMNGEMGVESEVGVGSTFWVQLPRMPQADS